MTGMGSVRPWILPSRTTVGDAEGCAWRNGEALGGVAGAHPCRPALPEHGPRKEKRLAGPSQAHADELRKENPQTFFELCSGGHLWSHESDDLLSRRTFLQRNGEKRCKLPYEGPSVQTLSGLAFVIQQRLKGILSPVKPESEVWIQYLFRENGWGEISRC